LRWEKILFLLFYIFQLFRGFTLSLQALVDFFYQVFELICKTLIARDNDIWFHDIVFPAAHVNDHTTSFLYYQSSRRNVPRFQVFDVVGVDCT
jgi:hypothetical protein